MKANQDWQTKIKKVIRLFFISFLFFSSFFIYAQESSSAYFNAVIKSTQEQFVKFPSLEGSHLKKFHLDRLQFRTETDEFEFNRQEYAIRVSPGNYRLADYQKDLFKAQQEKLTLLNERGKAAPLLTAYSIWLNFRINVIELSLKQKKISLLQDKLKVYNKQLDLPNFNVLRYIETEDALHNLELDVKELEVRIENQKKIIASQGNAGDSNTANDLISISSLMKVANNEAGLVNSDPLEKKILELDRMIIQKEIELENAESQQILDFLQLRYAGPHDDPFRERASISAGINLPTKSKNKLKINELLLEEQENDFEFQQEMEEQKYEVALALQELKEEFELFELVNTQNQNSILKNATIMERVEASSSTSPIDLLDIQLLAIEKEERLLNIKNDIYDAYLDWLEISGRSTSIPFINYLAEGLPTLTFDAAFWE